VAGVTEADTASWPSLNPDRRALAALGIVIAAWTTHGRPQLQHPCRSAWEPLSTHVTCPVGRCT
jgi:hypothetical protein